MSVMFPGFSEHRVAAGDGVEIFCRVGGSGPALLLLHGYPQTSAMWHRVAPDLARDHLVVCADLRGYGRSSKPASVADHASYSKRAMALDMAAVMTHFDAQRFFVGAHDRGARVAHRLAADCPARVRALCTLDIAPTREMYRATTEAFARAYWHWFFLIQKAPFPERMIGADPEAYWRKKCGSGSAGMTPFAAEALAEYLACFAEPDAIRGSCEDYRAAATLDIAHDDADGDFRLPMPVRALWGEHGIVGKCFDPLALWRRRAARVEGGPLPGGHYLAEECPERVIAEFRGFFARVAAEESAAV